ELGVEGNLRETHRHIDGFALQAMGRASAVPAFVDLGERVADARTKSEPLGERAPHFAMAARALEHAGHPRDRAGHTRHALRKRQLLARVLYDGQKKSHRRPIGQVAAPGAEIFPEKPRSDVVIADAADEPK